MFEELDTLERLRKVYERLHFQHLRAGNYEVALDYIQNALTIAETLKDTAMISLHLSDKSIIYHDFEDYEKGVEYGKRAFEIMNKAKRKNYKYLIYANNGIGINFDDWGKADSALFYHYKNLEYLKKVDDSLQFAFIFNNIGNTNLKMKNYEKAKQFINRSLEMNKIRDRDYNLASNYTNLATIAYEMNDYSLAKDQFKKAYFHAEKSESIEKIRDVVQQEAWFYKKIGDFEKALERQEAFYILRDSVFNEERSAKIAEIETRYETEKKEKLLAESRADLVEKELEVRKKNYMIYGSLGLAIILGLLSYLVYKQMRLKQEQLKKEHELKTALARIEIQNKLQEQRLRISRDLHDNIGAQLSFIISSIDNLKYSLVDEAILDKLSKISGFTTETIYQLRDTIWAMNKNDITFEDLQTRISNFIDNAKVASGDTQFRFTIPSGIDSEHTFTSIQGMNMYRIIQESVNNASKYAQASEISVSIQQQGSSFQITIEDNGVGFDQNNVEMGNGINNIKKRARQLGGQASITSDIGKGTRITFTVES
jgi:signal transduction histidine kinase